MCHQCSTPEINSAGHHSPLHRPSRPTVQAITPHSTGHHSPLFRPSLPTAYIITQMWDFKLAPPRTNPNLVASSPGGDDAAKRYLSTDGRQRNNNVKQLKFKKFGNQFDQQPKKIYDPKYRVNLSISTAPMRPTEYKSWNALIKSATVLVYSSCIRLRGVGRVGHKANIQSQIKEHQH